MMTKEQFKHLDLREQLTNELKNKWYYKERKWGLKINKHSVVFDGCFKFNLKYFNYKDIEMSGVTVDYDSLYFEEKMYSFNDRYNDEPNDILEDILVYIANYI